MLDGLPLVADVYSGQGGAGWGYRQAGFAVFGVDHARHRRRDGSWERDTALLRRYPFPLVVADALEFLASANLDAVDLIHASPPCYNRSKARAAQPVTEPDLIAPTRALLVATGKPYVIENVPSPRGEDPIRPDIKLCGCMFGRPRLQRQRWFETSWHAFALRAPCSHTERAISITRHGGPATNWGSHAERSAAMGISWMTANGLGDAIPPDYTKYIADLWREQAGLGVAGAAGA